jgi:hypothetical protein
MPTLVFWSYLGDASVQVAQFFFQLADLILQMEQHPVVQLLKLAVYRSYDPWAVGVSFGRFTQLVG